MSSIDAEGLVFGYGCDAKRAGCFCGYREAVVGRENREGGGGLGREGERQNTKYRRNTGRQARRRLGNAREGGEGRGVLSLCMAVVA